MVKESYDTYLVAYLDILGFTNKVEQSQTDPKIFNAIRLLLKSVQSFVNIVQDFQFPGLPRHAFASQMFSDSVIISCRGVNQQTFASMMACLTLLQCDVIAEGFLFRGSLVCGDTYEKEKIIFGPAVIQAIELEKSAGWSRVVVQPELTQIVKADIGQYVPNYFFLRNDDGLLYINYLQAGYILLKQIEWIMEYTRSLDALKEEKTGTYDFITRDYISEHRKLIVDEAASTADIEELAKAHSLAQYHNMVVDRLIEAIVAPKPEVALYKLDNFNLYMFSHLARRGHSKQVYNFLKTKFAHLEEQIPELQRNKIDLEQNFALLY